MINKQYDIVQYNTIQYNAIQYNATHYCTMKYNTIKYNKMQYSLLYLGAQEIRAAKVSESHTKKSDNDEDFNEQQVRSDFSGSFADFRASVKSLFSNPAYLCVLARATVGGFAVNALSSYGAKYMENQFRLPSYHAGAIFGKTVATCMAMKYPSGHSMYHVRSQYVQTDMYRM